MSLLEVEDLHAGYGLGSVLHGVSFKVNEGKVVTILGPNGAGKTTALRAVCGMISTRGSVRFDGKEIRGSASEKIARLGVAHVPEGRGTFTGLTVEENLRVGAYRRKDKDIKSDVQRFFKWFPRLEERRTQHAGSLSGGEQQMLAVARALMLKPRLLLLDEPSLGLAPLVTRELFGTLGKITEEEGLTVLVVEQNAHLVLKLADYAYVLESGRFALDGDAERIRNDEQVQRAYLGY
jgi:branched-chain amino acid transport system ATP-binding protein